MSQSRRPRVAINGFGRIGRAFARMAATDPNCPFDLVGANDLVDPALLAYLLKYDTTHRKFQGEVAVDGNSLIVGNQKIALSANTDPSTLPWGELGVDLVIESTGRFTKRSGAAQHLKAGARKVLISAPGDKKEEAPDATVVHGINSFDLKPEFTIVSAASCTTTCLAPIAKAVHDAFGIVQGTMTTVHAYTADQALMDAPHKKEWRRGRNAAQNIVPTGTGAAKAIGLVLPHLEGKLHGVSLRVPVQDVSLVDLVVVTEKPATTEGVNAALRAAAASFLPGVLRIETDLVVSSDLIGESAGSVADLSQTHVQGSNLVKVVAWYDNEWGYTSRLYALASHMLTLN
jgi:glyceraldehyde 3-phosphate dehydrogenase